MRHIIYTYKGKVYQAHKNWDVETVKKVMKRIGASYYEYSL